MWKPRKGHNSKSYGPLVPIQLQHLLFLQGSNVVQVSFKVLNKMWSHRIMELRKDIANPK